MNRNVLIRLADALEDAMIETGHRETEAQRRLWWDCFPLWFTLREILRGKLDEGRTD